MGRVCGMALVAAALVAAPAAAQQAGTVEFGALGRMTWLDPALGLDNATSFGGRVGVFVRDKWLVELDFTSGPALDSVEAATASLSVDDRYQPMHIRLNFVEPFSGRGEMVVGAGYFFQYWGASADAEDGFTGLFGLQFKVTGPWFARVDVTADYVTNPLSGGGAAWYTGLQLGIGGRFPGL